MIRRACVLLGMLTLILQGSSGSHMLLVEHSRCIEHGELVHGGDAHHHGIAEYQTAENPALHGTPDTGSDEAHDHCSLSADRRAALVAIAGADASIRIREASAEVTSRSAAFVPSQPRFRSAPKTSPPA